MFKTKKVVLKTWVLSQEKNMTKMKNLIQKTAIFSVLFSFIFFQGIAFLPKEALAASPAFNNDPQDKETLRLANSTKGETTWKDPVSAEAGDRIAFNVYYHNTVSGTVAKNTKIRLDFENNKSGKLTFRAYVFADNANYVSDIGTVNVPCDGLNFVFENQAKWYPNQTTSNPQILPVTFVQSNSILVNIGDIAGGWQSQGQVVLYGRISEFSPRFNYMTEDKETLRLANKTKGETTWHDPVSADGGDTIAFNVYYHNGVVCSTARNTRISIEFPQEAGNKIVTVGIIEADNATAVYNQGTINVSGMPEKLTFKTTAKWYPNGTTSNPTILPVTISGNRATVVLGDIKGCWEYQGQVVFEADLSSTPMPRPTPKPEITYPGEVLGAYTEKQVASVPKTGAASVIMLSALSSIIGYGTITKRRMKEKILGSKLERIIEITRKKKGM